MESTRNTTAWNNVAEIEWYKVKCKSVQYLKSFTCDARILLVYGMNKIDFVEQFKVLLKSC